MELKITTPTGSISRNNVSKVSLPGAAGTFMVLHNHAPILSLLNRGTIEYEADGQMEALYVTGGVVEVKQNRVTVLIKEEGKEMIP